MFEVSIVKHIQTISNDFSDGLFKAITLMGDELFFILVAVVLYWCVDKRFGFKVINVYLLGCTAVEGIKSLVARPRPYTYEGVVSIGERTSGYSFPSGHSHSIANLSTQTANRYRKKWLIVTLSVICLLVMFSRVYLGQHFISDVLVGAALGVGLAIGLGALFELLREKEEYVVLGVLPVCLIILLVLVATRSTSSAGNVMNVLGGYSAVCIGYFVEKRYVKSNNSAVWYVQILKVVVGVALTLAVKEGFKLFIPKTAPVLYHFVRYFCTALVASLGAPALFKLAKTDKIGAKEEAHEE